MPPSVDVDALDATPGLLRNKSRLQRGPRVCAQDALTTALGSPIATHELRALCAAWADWMNPDDDHTAGEGMRALPDEERDAAFRFFAQPELLTRFGELVQSSPEVFDCFANLDPVQGPCMDAERAGTLRGRAPTLRELDEFSRRGMEAYHQAVGRRQQALGAALLHANRRMRGGSSPKPLCPPPPRRPPCGRSPRRREHRSTTRRKSASRAGPDDPAEPEPPLAVASKAVAQ